MTSVNLIYTIITVLAGIQSLVWGSLGIAAILYSTGVISTYKGIYQSHFQSVTHGSPTVKIDFFEDEDSFLKSLHFFILAIVYTILHCFSFILTILFFKRKDPKTKADLKQLISTISSWGTITVLISAMDLLLFARSVITMIINKKIIDDSLIIAVVASRFGVFWFWNVLVGGILLFNSFCRSRMIGIEIKEEEKVKEEVIEKKKEENTSNSPPPEPVSSPDWERYRYSLEGFTDFKKPEEKTPSQYSRTGSRQSYHQPPEPTWFPPITKKIVKRSDEWSTPNENYVYEESSPVLERLSEADRMSDYDHYASNFEQGGQRKIKILKPPIGKPVSIPIPPPLPKQESYQC